MGEGIKCGVAGADCSVSPQEGTRVALSAQPERGYTFDVFTGDCAPGGTTTMAGPRTCGASFRPVKIAPVPDVSPSPRSQRLTIAKPTGGTIIGRDAGITCGTMGSSCVVTVAEGSQVSLIAQADPGYRLTGFTGDCASDGKTTMTSHRECGAVFSAAGPPAVTEQPLTITRPAGGTITAGTGINCGTQGAACSASFATGTQVQLQAHADDGFTFRSFTDDCAASGATTMTGPRTCGVAFDRAPVIPRPPSNPKPKQVWTNPMRRARDGLGTGAGKRHVHDGKSSR